MDSFKDKLAGKKVVLIEDNVFLGDVISKKLELSGAEVVFVKNGLEGLATVRSVHPDLVLLDIMMPIMNGYEVLEVMKSEGLTEKIPTIVISNSGQPVEIDRVKELGVQDYIVKADFEPNEVIEKVFSVLNIDGADDKIEGTGFNDEGQIGANSEKPRVLVVEDDPLLRNILSLKLAQTHCPFMFSSDGIQAFSLIKQFEPHVIILDLMLPGKSGFEILEEVKADEVLKNIPVVIFSNKDTAADRKKAEELGAKRFFVKAMTDLTEFTTLIESIGSDFKNA